MKMIKKMAKILKVYIITKIFIELPIKEYVLYTQFNVDNFRWPLKTSVADYPTFLLLTLIL